ncbi:MAG: phosphopyruvate hydratase [Flavobacteriales bacterium]|nr:phosphopyruvate hydratase [Flavobacteriales bacterium]|tara:strand:+ start:1385 stop:2656 length:1272 start_codon:yes stop_codon:yes gene_type:complete
MSKIQNIIARQILDSRGNPTVEVDVYTQNGMLGRASAPSGASTGIYEALEIRDHKLNYYRGKSVLKAIQNINNYLKPALLGLDIFDQAFIDQKMIDLDGTDNKSNLGANAILPISLAVAKAASAEKKIGLYEYLSNDQFILPVPMMNILNGGMHADNNIDFQEFMIIPNSANSFSDALRMGTEVFYALKDNLKKRNFSTNVGDEGGFAPNIVSNKEAIDIILLSIIDAGYKVKDDISIAIDAAASEFYDKNKKLYCFGGNELNSSDMVSFWTSWIDSYPIISIEDALDEDDWAGWAEMTKQNSGIQLVGDDLFVTSNTRLQKGIDQSVANSILIKLNQIGTLTETLATIELAKKNNYTTVISHRSGETEDVTIADLAVGSCAGQIKTGSVSRSDRVSKYNQLLRIEEKLGPNAIYQGFPNIKK